MKTSTLVLSGWVLLALFALTHWSSLLADLQLGVMIGAGVVVFVLYPVKLRELERRVAELEGGGAEES